MNKINFILITGLILAVNSFALTIDVPGDYPTIQEGINASVTGDTVLVKDGVYTGSMNKNLVFNGRQIVVKSASGPEYCIINCENNGIGFILEAGETHDSVVEGFTITNGQNSPGYGNNAGAINIEDSSPLIKDCILIDNDANWDGGGICCLNSNAKIENCFIANNYSPHSGGGISIPYDSNVLVIGCTIVNNTSSFLGSGILVYLSTSQIVNCTISGNTGGAAGINVYGSSASILNTIVHGHSTGIAVTSSSNASIDYCDFYSNSNNFSGSVPPQIGLINSTNYNGDPCDQYSNIFLDPIFIDPSHLNYDISEGSPCIDAGDPNSPLNPDFTIADIGARYYDQGTTAPSLTVTMTPESAPVVIPSGGGYFNYTVLIENSGISIGSFDGWIMVVLPDGSEREPFRLSAGILLNPGESIVYNNITQYVPGSAPSGEYSYRGNAGIFPVANIANDSFAFVKLPGEGISNHQNGWKLYGGEDSFKIQSENFTPDEYTVLTVYPNPFNPSTIISFELRDAGQVSLRIYDVQGREVAKLIDGFESAGSHQVVFDGGDLSSGVYFAVLKAGDFEETQKLLLLK